MKPGVRKKFAARDKIKLYKFEYRHKSFESNFSHRICYFTAFDSETYREQQVTFYDSPGPLRISNFIVSTLCLCPFIIGFIQIAFSIQQLIISSALTIDVENKIDIIKWIFVHFCDHPKLLIIRMPGSLL